MSEELKSCPFCGSPARIIKNDYEPDDPEYVAICDGCGCDIRCINKSDVVTLWNNRTAEREKMIGLVNFMAVRLKNGLQYGLGDGVDDVFLTAFEAQWKGKS
jgi:Lar family restriction alleviation protein